MILTVTKIVNDLERIGDETKKVAYKASESTGHQRVGPGAVLRRRKVGRAREEMLQLALDAFARMDVNAARTSSRSTRRWMSRFPA
jgi:phosphate transport system protein